MTGDTAGRQDRADLAREGDPGRDRIVGGGTRRGDEQEQKGGAGREGPCLLSSTFCLLRYSPPPGLVVITAPGATPSIE